jgi:hypothetical protein
MKKNELLLFFAHQSKRRVGRKVKPVDCKIISVDEVAPLIAKKVEAIKTNRRIK